ncbi:DNA-directed RNA polymerase iii subunit rpc3 [Phtheirospermum japonicum]|uniref:DNA-directed RNA polymerase III subunit RPC3 n=1 Tax=Phtheirospermum japonicum TaxID=374723 RepID=A0A830B573_9LAMI|nr:DNA-directed RNA polymerase iii subunit rpc3 [Phtheirospermum japonicum]
MVSPHGVQLAAHLISSFYGDLCSKVCECLLRRGNLTLLQIIQSTELTRENVINCLRVLIHQNCIQAFSTIKEGSFGEAARTLTQYMALFDNIIHKLRAPKFMQIVSEELGKDCLGIFQGLVQHGRLSFKQITERSEDTTGIIYRHHFPSSPPPPPPHFPFLSQKLKKKKTGIIYNSLLLLIYTTHGL